MGVIRDPDSLKGATVNAEGQLVTFSTIESEMHRVSEHDGRAFSWSNVSYDYTAGDTILAVKNTSSVFALEVHSIFLSGDTATIATIHRPTIASPTGTAVTGVNWNSKSNLAADATAIANEETNSQGSIFLNPQIEAAKQLIVLMYGSVILGQNQSIAVDYETNGAACYVTIVAFFHLVVA